MVGWSCAASRQSRYCGGTTPGRSTSRCACFRRRGYRQSSLGRVAGRGVEARRDGDRRGAELRSRPCRACPPHLRSRARIRCRYRHASRFRDFAGGDGHPSGLRADQRKPASADVSRSDICASCPPCLLPRPPRAGAAHRGCRGAVTVLPATGLFTMGRDQDYNVRRGVADVALLAECGVNRSLSTKNVLNPFTPFGRRLAAADGEPPGQCLPGRPGVARLRDCFATSTQRSARLMNLKDYGITAGNPADIVVLDERRRSRPWRRSAIRSRCSSAAGGPRRGHVRSCTGQRDWRCFYRARRLFSTIRKQHCRISARGSTVRTPGFGSGILPHRRRDSWPGQARP